MELTKKPEDSFAIVTPSYFPDLARCELMSESLRRVAPHVPHYLIVDRRDRAAFHHLEQGNRRIIESEELVGRTMWRMPGSRGFWLSFRAPPVRGWIIQQILKIALVDVITERTLVFCDSDTAFFRPFDRKNLMVDEKIGLLDVDFVDSDIRRWTTSARRLLGLSPRHNTHRNHVGNMICWNRETVTAMQRRIEASTGVGWQIALARTSSFSEYMLYGIFVREVLGYNTVDHAPSSTPLVKPSWGVCLTTDSAIKDFFTDVDPRTVAVMIHSKGGPDPSRLRLHLEHWWNQLS